ncbi:PIN domain-containing protein [Candidatus Daviesbacteria bacterium]|nr:PIN domain-containing protein [Candidatus Daviesbacteria bacterium]
MTTYLLNSDIIIDYLAKRESAIALIEKIIQLDELPAVSVLIEIEVKIGLKDAQIPKINKFFDALTIIPLTNDIAQLAIEFIRSFGKKGRALYLVDACIVATAIKNNLILVTNNKKDYPMEGLKLI